jgi:decaprenyl-phosphate phosphoribosyltransferase
MGELTAEEAIAASPGNAAVESARRPRALPAALLAASRPRQWSKNVLVFAAPAAAVVAGRHVESSAVVLAAVCFCAVSAGTYLLNDTIDAEADRLHPAKRLRPVAAGELRPALALLSGAVLLAAGVGGGFALSGAALAAVLAGYGAVSLAYSLVLKQVPVVELLCISSGFVLRTVAGGVAAAIPISPWFFVVACSGSILVASGKRTAELMALGESGSRHRAALGWYRASFLAQMRRGAAAVTVASYGIWAITHSPLAPGRRDDGLFMLLSVVPFAVSVVLIERALAAGEGGAPEELPLKNRLLQAAGAFWALCLLVAFAA